jgi:hypothetical protein
VTIFIPALLAVLLAEAGGRSALFARLPHLGFAALIMGVAVGASAVAGQMMAPAMTAHARALMLSLALLIAAAGWFEKPLAEPPAARWDTLRLVWRSSTPFLAFAFAIWKGAAIGAAAGALTGFAGAVLLGSVAPAAILRPVRAMALTAIAVTGLYSALWALRLIA